MKKTIIILFFFSAFTAFQQTVAQTLGSIDTISYIGSKSCVNGSLVLTANNFAAWSSFKWQLNGTDIPGATTNTYTATQSGTYRVLVKANNITTDLYYPDLIVTIAPVASFNSSASNQCGNTPVNFTSTSTGNSLQYEWNFGDPNSSGNNTTSNNNPSHTFIGTTGATSENFTVSVKVTDNASCTSTVTNVITIKQLPIVDLQGNNSTVYNGSTYFRQCTGAPSGELSFKNIGTLNASLFQINWGDGTPDFNQTTFPTLLKHTYSVGTYEINYTVTGISGCIQSKKYYAFIGSNPKIGITNPGNTSICTSDSLAFPITFTNSPGTIYTASFNDGSTHYNFDPLVTPYITHKFIKISCGTSSITTDKTYANSFAASVTATNPCDQSSGSAVPIYVSDKPKAKFSLLKDTTCVNTNVQLSNSSSSNQFASSNGCTSGKSIWVITPGVKDIDWSIVAGSLGSQEGLGIQDMDFWTDGSQNLTVKFLKQGTYSIKLLSGNPNCLLDSITKTICVNPKPTATFTVDKQIGCMPLTVATTNTTLAPNCGGNTYQWSVTYTSPNGCIPTPTARSYTFASGTNATSASPQFLFSNPGIYTIGLIVTSPGGCVSTAFTKDITVQSKPNVSAITALTPICENGKITPTSTINNCYSSTAETYSWTFSGGIPSNSTSVTPGDVLFNTGGTYSIQLVVTNQCGNTTVTKDITVNPIPTLTVPANKTVCAGTSTGNLSFTSDGSISWTIDKTGIGVPGNATSGTGNTINVFSTINSTSNPIIVKVVVTASNNNCSKKDSFNITINPKPVKPAVTRPVNYCFNDAALALSATPLANHTLTWYTLNTLVGGSTTAITPNISTAGTTNYFVTQTNTYNCPSDSATIPVTVTAAITNNTIKTDQALCGTSSAATITSDAIISGGNGTYNYQWQQFNGSSWVNIVSATSASYAPASVSVTTKYRRLVTSSSCNSISNEVTVTVIPGLSSTNITGLTQTICEGTSPTILDGQNASGGSGTYSYTWESSNDNSNWSVISSANSEDYLPPSLSATSYYRRKISSGVCSATSSVVKITVNPKPLATIAVASTICDYNIANATFTATKGTGPFNVEVTVTKPSSGGDSLVTKTNINSGASISVIAANSMVGNYSIVLTKITDSKGCVTTNTAPSINVNIISKPSLTISQTADICSGGNASLTVSGATTYSWTPSATLSSSSASTVTATPTTTTTYTVKGTTSGCDNTASVIVTVNPKPVIPDQSVNICSNSSFTNNPVNGGTSIVPAGTTYTWSLPVSSPLGAITGGSAQSVGQASISQILTNNTTSDATLTYTVTPSSGNCTGGSFKVVVTVKPQPGISDQNVAICSGTAFSATPIGAPTNTTYTWANDPVSNPIGAITGGTKQTTSIATIGQTLTNTTNAPAVLTYTVTPSSGGCGNGSFTVAVTVNPKPAVTKQTTAVCSGTAFTVTPTNVPSGTTYTWVSPVISPANAITGGAAQSVGQTSISQTLTNTTNANATATYNVVPTSGAGGSCAGSAFEVVVTVNPKPNIPSYTVSSCSGTAFTSTQINGNGNVVPSGTTYTWALPTVPSELTGAATGTSLSAIGGTLINTSNASKTAIYTVTPTSGASGNCLGADFTVTVTVNPKPSITNQSITVCSGEAISFLAVDGIPTAATIVPSGTTYSWAVPTLPTGLTGAVLGNNASSFTNTLTNNTNIPKTITYTVTPKVGTCDGQTFTITVIVNPKPVIANQKQIVCSGTPFTQQLVDASPTTIIPKATTYTWAVPTVTGSITGGIAGNNETSIGGTLINTGNIAQTATYIITPTSGAAGTCVGSAFDVIIKVNPIPNITANGNDPDSCGKPSGSITITGLITDSIYTVNYTLGGVLNTLQNQKAVNGAIVIPKLASGSYTSISLVLNNCPSNIIGSVSLKDPKSPDKPILSATNPVCSGTSLTLNIISPEIFLTYVWSGPGGITGNSGSITIPKTIMANNGTVSVTATKNSCTSDAGSIIIKVDSTPVAPTVTTPITICSNNTINLTASTVSVGTGSINYAWSGPSSFSNSNQNTTITNAQTNASGTYSVTATATNGNCTSAASDVLVTVNPTPVITANSTNPDSCAKPRGYIVISGLFNGEIYTVNYNKDGTAQTALTLTASASSVTIPSLTSGTYDNIIVTSSKGCASNKVGPYTLSDPFPPATPTIIAANPVCSSKPLTLNISSPDNSLTYIWSGQGGISGTGISITITKTIMANNGTVSVTATKNSCTSPAGAIVIQVDSTPVKPTVTSPKTICSNSNVQLNASSPSTSSGSISYAWTGPNSYASSIQNPLLSNVQTIDAGLYIVTTKSSVGNCISDTSGIKVVVNLTPFISNISSNNPDKCAAATGTIKFKVSESGKTYTVSYNDGSAKTKDVTSDANGYISIGSLLAGTYSNISVTTMPEGCTSNIVGPFSLVDPSPPATPVITGDSVLCSGKNLTLNSPAVTDATYKWQAPNGTIVATTQNLQLAAITTGQSGLYKLTVTVNNCISGAGTKNVLVDSTPAKPSISSNSPLCSGSDLALKANTVSSGNMVYAWIGPNGFTNNAANPTIPNVTETASGTYIVSATATVSNCVSDTANIVVLVRPELTKATISGLDSLFICGFAPPANASQQLTGSIDAARAFEKGKWSIISQPTGGNGVFTYDSTATTNFAYAKSGLYNIAFTITNDINCPATKDTVVLSIIDKPAITNELKATATSICAGNPVTIQVPLSAISGQIKYWQFKRPSSAANWQDTLVTNPSITFNNVQDTFSVRLVVISTDQLHCSGDTAFKPILINVAPPSLPGISAGEDTVCQNANSGSVTLTGNIGLPVSWQLSTDGTNFTNIVGTAAQNYTYTNLTVSTWFRAAVKSGACDTVFSNATNITVFPPVKAAIAGSDAELCGDSTYQLSGNLPGTYESGLWSFAAGSPTANFDDATKASTTLRNMQPNNNYQLLWTLSNGICPSTFSKITIKNYLPLTNTIDTNSITVCNSASVTANGLTAIGGNQPYLYQWQSLKGNVWVNITGANNPSYSFTADTTVKLRRLVTATPCTNTSLEKTVYVQPPLANNTITGAAETCINTTPGLLVGSLPTGGDGNYIYQWQILQGTNWTDIAGATQKNYIVPVLLVNTAYRRLVTSALCSGNQGLYSSQFEITVRPDAEAKWTITKDTACAPFVIDNAIVTPTLIPTKNVNYSWYANGNTYGNSATTNPGYTLSKPGDSITIKMVANSLYGCKNDSLSHVFFTIPPVLTNFAMSDTTGCGPLKVTFTNTTPYLGFFTYQWYFGNNQTSTLAQPGSITYASNPNFGDTTYLISLTATSECESVIKIKPVTVASKPKSIFTPSKTTGCSPMTVSFTNLSKGIGVTYLWNFGDGNVLAASTKQSVSHVFSSGVQDTFLVKLIAMNQCGNDTSTYKIVVSPNQIRLDVAVNGNQKQVCKPATVRFINASSGATSFNWNFGDGNVLSTTKNLDTVSHTFLQAGNYTVTLFATNGCSDTTTTELIQVFNAPSANFNAVPTTVCLGDTIRFTNQSDTITSLLWNFKDGYTSTVNNPTHAYKVAGIYSVQLTAIRQYNSGLACIDSIAKPITVLSTLPGAMKVSDSISSCVPFTTTFTNLSLPSAITIWQYGNGVADTGNVVTYTYTKVGNYTVNMLATNSGGCKFVASANIQVSGPEGIWQHDKGFVCGDTPVRYEVFATGTDSVRWVFGDGISITTSGKIIYHTYTKSGMYLPSATLISSSLKTCTVTLKAIDTIKVDYVSAGFRISDNKICDLTTVTFTDTSRSYFPIANYSWSFGNGNTATTPIATQQYTTTNTWQTDLTITSTSGCSSTINKNSFIKVNNYPKVTIQTQPVACINKPTNYFANVTSNDSINLYSWQFSNGVNLNGQSVNNLYNTVGTYTAKVLVRTIYGCADSITLTHTLNPTPTVIASVDQLICRGKSVPLSASGATTYSWVPLNSNLSCYTCTNPIAAPTTTTNYIVTGYNSVGCSDDDTVLITVAQPIKLTVSPNDTICIGQSSQLSVTGATSYVWSPSIGLSNTTSATPLATPTLTTKYQVIGFDNHNCFQDTAYVVVAVGQYPTIQLAADQVLATGTLLPLNYTSTNGPLTSWKWTPATNLSCNNCAVPIATIKKDVCYTVVAANIYKCAATDTICIKVFCENTQVFIPNVFTPDNDGINDILMVRGTGIKTVKSFRIFNRWGQIVFERGNITPNNASQGWDGKINGTPASPDVYVYTCEVVCENDVTFTYKGNVAIIK